MPILGTPEHSPAPDKGTNQLAQNRPPVPLGAGSANHPEEALKPSSEERLLAAVAYGEGSTKNVFEEMAGIAAVLIRQAQARDETVGQFLRSEEAKTYAFALANGTHRFVRLQAASEYDISKDVDGMLKAVKAARHALAGKKDYSEGAYFWDGEDLKSNYANHYKVKKGVRFAKKEHDIYSVGDNKIKEVIKYWVIKDKAGHTIQGSERGRYDCTYESTAGIGGKGGTVFWRYTPEFLQATGNKEFK